MHHFTECDMETRWKMPHALEEKRAIKAIALHKKCAE